MADLHPVDSKKSSLGPHMLVETASDALPLSPPPSSSSSVSPCSSLSETIIPSAVGSGIDSGTDINGQHHHRHYSLLDVTRRPLDRAPRQSDQKQQRPHSVVGSSLSSSSVSSTERMTTAMLVSRRRTATVSGGRPQSAILLPRTRSRNSTFTPVIDDHYHDSNSGGDAPVHSYDHPSSTGDIEMLSSKQLSSRSSIEQEGDHPFWDGESNSASLNKKRPLDRAAAPSPVAGVTRPLPTLRRRSTNSMIAGIRLSGNSDEEEMEDEQHSSHHHLLLHRQGRRDDSVVIKRQSSRTTLLRRDRDYINNDRERQPLQCITPDTDTGAVEFSADRPLLRRTVTRANSTTNFKQCPLKLVRRKPLGDISFSAATDDKVVGTEGDSSINNSSLRESKRPRLTEDKRTFTSPYFEEYGEDVFQHMLEIECRHDRYFYSEQHPTIQGSTRCVLVDWVIHLGYFILRMQPETVHHGVNLLDRYMIEQSQEVPVDRLQCISVAALLVAGKLVETATRLSTNALSYACSHAFSAQNITDQELDLLKTLKFELTVASVSTFAQYFKQALELDQDLDYLIDYLCDVSLLSHHFLSFNLSTIAAAAISLALQVKGRVWTKEMEMLSGFPPQALMPCIEVFMQTLKNIRRGIPCSFSGLQEKYPMAELNFL